MKMSRASRLFSMLWWRAAPSLEVANALLAAMRRGRLTPPQRKTALAALGDLAVRVEETAPSLAWTTYSEIADDLQLTIYDAAYLELALRKAMPLATLDKALRRAAVSAGAQLFAVEPH